MTTLLVSFAAVIRVVTQEKGCVTTLITPAKETTTLLEMKKKKIQTISKLSFFVLFLSYVCKQLFEFLFYIFSLWYIDLYFIFRETRRFDLLFFFSRSAFQSHFSRHLERITLWPSHLVILIPNAGRRRLVNFCKSTSPSLEPRAASLFMRVLNDSR